MFVLPASSGSYLISVLRRLSRWTDAEYCKLCSEAAVQVPTHVDAAKYAPILCAGVTFFNAIRKMNIPPGATVGIQGLGGLGHLAIQYAHKLGYRVCCNVSRLTERENLHENLAQMSTWALARSIQQQLCRSLEELL